ncbi:hypothetical protein CVIRNUC_008623 [Coccomyxa viridis]|uniref:Uncharacterized protein n=1 Tax=Coccomyxa viridis TaxID=1274662 RepID=A0AAV1IDI1_9CHLO|nr:hypothetical protein CVIRNUC_008623 [Coccomyxa viridis]
MASREERSCRFCDLQLPEWTSAYASLPRGEPLMTISHNGRVFLLSAKPGLKGRDEFIANARAIFDLQDDELLELNFGCKVPGSPGEEINLEGWDCYDAAVHCASICAGQRATKALNVASTDVMHPCTHVVLGPGAPSSQEPFQAPEAEEGLGCWKLLKATVSSMWDSCLDVLQQVGKRIADEVQALSGQDH